MKHVLIVFTGEFKTQIYPLGGVFQFEHALALNKNGIKTGVIAPGLLSVRRILNNYPYKKYGLIKGISVFRYFKQNFFPARIGLYNLLLAKEYEKIGLDLFEKYIKKFGKPDLIHAHDIRFGIYVANVINKKYKIPFLTTECSSETAENLFPNPLKKSAISILKKSKAVTACSKPFSKVFSKKLELKNIKVGTIYPVLPHDLSKNLILKKKERKVFTFITVNRLDKNKNIKLIVKSFIKGFKNENAILKIIGHGPEFKNLINISKANNTEKKIIFIRKATREMMKKELANSDCFLSSSFHETFGVVLIEALALGVPVISTRAEGPSEIVNNKNGFLVKHNDTTSYTKCMKKIFLKKKKFNRLNLRKNIIKRFGTHKFAETTIKIYKKCLR